MSQSQILLRAGEMALRSTLSFTRTGMESLIECISSRNSVRRTKKRLSTNLVLKTRSIS